VGHRARAKKQIKNYSYPRNSLQKGLPIIFDWAALFIFPKALPFLEKNSFAEKYKLEKGLNFSSKEVK
jgi:hypothetical protein